jgi:hypothetical protein
MLMQVLLLAPYIAIASSVLLGVTVAVICCSKPARLRAEGFEA